MRLVRRLDDLDARVIGRGNPNWRSPTPKPWSPEVGPLWPVRGAYLPLAVVLAAGGVTGLAIVLAVPVGDHPVLGVLIGVALFVTVWSALMGLAYSRFLGNVTLVPPNVPVEESRPALWIRASAVVPVLLAPVVLAAIFEWELPANIFSAVLLGSALDNIRQARRVARWEDEHGGELLQARGRAAGLYACPRPGREWEPAQA